jgi:hypothetical protein
VAGCDKLVVAHPERKAQRALARLVGATLCPVQVADDVEALSAAIDPTTIVVIDASLAQRHPDVRKRPAAAWICVPGEGLAPADGAGVDALLAAGWDHVVSHPMPILAEELLATVQKLLRGDVFGVEKYMAWAAEVRSYRLGNTSERDEVITAIASDIVAAGLPERIGSQISVIADELVANALYVAPVDERGERFRRAEPRDQLRALDGRDTVTLRWATDARYLAVEVRDRYGSIDASSLGRRLPASGKQNAAPGETGMGLPLVYACANQVVVGVAPGELTEVLAILDVRYKPTELGRSASFHVFTGKAP